MTFTVDSFKFG